ncbi:MAG: hypothetical protein RMY16_03310 [Nostoc sp. DedQUE12b]|uniref:hypothetical protein n=1 Tax=Nostoc sp. DedQUE09 TaxID=3075394 RepID=UPI002AD2053B|nr:hypothetical protein [Nostoc sp. DedQUE09]MDZ7949701.1 hypothetical protein [Nostoc sp. DedQUE09]MDZ8084612.1 hypothetical protein [Nostoc sp. DedQUE12b]
MKAPIGIMLCQISLSLLEELSMRSQLLGVKNHFIFLINLPNKYSVSILEEFNSG